MQETHEAQATTSASSQPTGKKALLSLIVCCEMCMKAILREDLPFFQPQRQLSAKNTYIRLAFACNDEREHHAQPELMLVLVLAYCLLSTHRVCKGFCLDSGPHGQQLKAGPSSVGAWLTQSLAAIKRRGRSADDGQSLAIPPANGIVHEQHQVLVDSLVPQAAPAGARSDTPAAVPVTAQHAEQAVKVKRKPGRPRKIPLKIGAGPPASTVTHPLSTPAAGTSMMQLTFGPHLPYGVVHLPDAQLALSPPAAGPQSNAADAVPAGALMPHRRSSSVQIDMSKLLKSRTKAQLPSSKSSGSGTTTPAPRAVTGAIIPEGTSVVPTNGPPNSTVVQSPAAAAADLAVAPAAEATGAELKIVSEAGQETAPMASEAAPFTASQSARGAADLAMAMAISASAAATAGAPKSVPQAEEAAVVSKPAPITGSEGGTAEAAAADKPVTPVDSTGSPAKHSAIHAAVRQQSAASSVTLSAPVSTIAAPVSPTSPTATSGKLSQPLSAHLSGILPKCMSCLLRVCHSLNCHLLFILQTCASR